jgi:hypothetical protein
MINDDEGRSLKYTQDHVCMINDDEGRFTVKGTNGNDHQVSFGKSSTETAPSCTHRDWVAKLFFSR